MNFFGWLREGVRQSILAGVNDAMEQIGGNEHPELNQQFLSAFKEQQTTIGFSATQPKSKRLGRSLKDLQIDPRQTN